MALETLSCPKCGGPLHVEAAQYLVTCAYCGTTIPIAPSPASRPVADEVEIAARRRADEAREITARRTAIQALELRLQSLAAERERLEREIRAPLERLDSAVSNARASGRIVRGIVALWALVLLLSVAAMLWGPRSTPGADQGLDLHNLASLALLCLLAPAGAYFLVGGSLRGPGRARRLEATRPQVDAEVLRRDLECRSALPELDKEMRSALARVLRLQRQL